jgi:hypothetical protein
MDGEAPRFLLRDRDDKFGPAFDRVAKGAGAFRNHHSCQPIAAVHGLGSRELPQLKLNDNAQAAAAAKTPGRPALCPSASRITMGTLYLPVANAGVMLITAQQGFVSLPSLCPCSLRGLGSLSLTSPRPPRSAQQSWATLALETE